MKNWHVFVIVGAILSASDHPLQMIGGIIFYIGAMIAIKFEE